MTIYDADFAEELAQQNQAGVKDSVAENHDSQTQENPLEQAADASIQAEQPQEASTDKEMNFRAIREELARLKAEKAALEQNFDDWKRDLASNNVRREPEAPRKSAIEELPDDDFISGAQLKRLLAEREAALQKRIEKQEVDLQETYMKSMYADYDEVTSKYGAPLVRQKPDLYRGFMSAQNKADYLYTLGKMAQMSERQQEQAEAPVQNTQKAERIMQNAKKPGTLSGAIGGQQAISKVDYMASMSDKDFQQLVAKHLEEV